MLHPDGTGMKHGARVPCFDPIGQSMLHRQADEAWHPGPRVSRPVSGRWTRHGDGARTVSDLGRPPSRFDRAGSLKLTQPESPEPGESRSPALGRSHADYAQHLRRRPRDVLVMEAAELENPLLIPCRLGDLTHKQLLNRERVAGIRHRIGDS